MEGKANKGSGDIMPNKYPITDEEAMYQLFLLYGSKKKAAEVFGCDPRTVAKVVKERESLDPDYHIARARSAARVAGKIGVTAEKVLDSITDQELKTKYDDKGKRTGPSIVEKGTLFGILKDKERQTQEYINLIEDKDKPTFLIPSDLQGLLTGIAATASRLMKVSPQFRQDNPDLAERTAALLASQPDVEIIDLTEDEDA